MQSVTLIIDKRIELSTKYKKLLESESNQVVISRDLITSIKIIKDTEPDLIIISDSFDNDLSDFCKQVRALTYNMRPVIVALSKSADFNDRINVLNSGADDFLSEPVNPKEFQVRINAHLRREYESNLDIKQFLPSRNYTLRAIKIKISQNSPWAMLYISIENFEEYKQAYTEIASDKLLQTYSAIVKASLTENDFIGQLKENVFFVITHPLKAESVAKFLTFAFDSVVNKFYAEHDLHRGYMILQGDEFAGKRANFAHFTISAITNEVKEYLTSLDFTLLSTILDIQGYHIKIMSEYSVPKLEQIPALIIVDAGNIEKQNGLNLCYKLKSMEEFKNTKIIVTSIIHDKELVLNSGADLYLPKPYEVSNLIKWVDSLVREFNG